MATREELEEIARGGSFDSESGFVAKYGKTQEKILLNFNTGVARLFGLPRMAVDLLEKGEEKLMGAVGIDPDKSKLSTYTGKKDVAGGFLPTATDIQNLGAEAGVTYAVGEEPQDLGSRITQNIGTVAPILPFFPLAALAPELTAATAGAVGGKIMEGTEYGQKHPELARAIGELGGGLSPVGLTVVKNFFLKGGVVGAGARMGKKGYEKAKSSMPKTEERVGTRLKGIVPDPELRISKIETGGIDVGGLGSPVDLTPGQLAGGGVARLSRTVERDIPEYAEEMVKKRIEQHAALEKQLIKTGNIGDARALIESELTLAANNANKALSRVAPGSDSAALSIRAEEIIKNALEKARIRESSAWNSLPGGETAYGSNLLKVHTRELKNITKGGSLKEISDFAKNKLGRLRPVIKKGKKTEDLVLKGGALFNKDNKTASAKAIHQFYSQLGRERAVLARQGGTANKIRIIDDLRAAALKDLEDAGLSAPYIDAIKLSKDLNRTFNKGAMGKITGLGRGEAVNPTKVLDELIGKGGQSGKEAIQQALRGAPETRQNIEDFIKVQFALAASENNVINARSGNAFLKNFDEILTDVFPSLKADLQDAIAKQVSVDELVGAPIVSQVSPFIKEKTAASVFLKANPGEEMATIINSTKLQRAEVLTDLVKLTSKDPSGKALKGLQNGFTEEIFKFAKKGDIVSGKKIIEKIEKLKPALLKSGLFKKDDISRFNRIGDAFEKIAAELKAKELGQIIDDIPSRLLSNSLRIIAVRLTGRLNRFVNSMIGGGDFGASLQTANIASREAIIFAKSLTNDEARNLLIKAVKDPELMTELLRDISKISTTQRQGIFSRIGEKVKALKSATPSQVLSGAGRIGKEIIKKADLQPPRVGAVVPPAASADEAARAERERQSNIKLLQEFIKTKAAAPVTSVPPVR